MISCETVRDDIVVIVYATKTMSALGGGKGRHKFWKKKLAGVANTSHDVHELCKSGIYSIWLVYRLRVTFDLGF